MSSIEIFDSTCFLKFSPITKQFDAPKHHNLGFVKQEIWKLDTST